MEYLKTLCFAEVNSKRRDFQQERREKQELQQPLSRQSSVCRDKTSKQMARELCRNNIFCVATQDLKMVDELCCNKRQHVAIRNGEKPVETKISYVAT